MTFFCVGSAAASDTSIRSAASGRDWITLSYSLTPEAQWLIFKGTVESKFNFDPSRPLSDQFERAKLYELLKEPGCELERYLLARCNREHPLAAYERSGTHRLSYDELALRSLPSVLRSPEDFSLESDFNGIRLGVPLINAPMNTVVTPQLLDSITDVGGLALGHRFHVDLKPVKFDEAKGRLLVEITDNPWGADRQTELIARLKDPSRFIGVTGLLPEKNQFALGNKLLSAGCQHLFTDVNFSMHERNSEMLVKFARQMGLIDERGMPISEKFKGRLLLSGCADDEYAALFFFRSHATGFRIGVANGAGCSTGDVTLFGLPSASAVSRCAWMCKQLGLLAIADGGYRPDRSSAGAVALGADVVMMGSRLSSTSDSNAPVLPNGMQLYHGAAHPVYTEAERAKLGLTGSRPAHGRGGMNVVSGSARDFMALYGRVLRENFACMGARNLAELRFNANAAPYPDRSGRWVTVDPFAHSRHRGNGTDGTLEIALKQQESLVVS